MNVEPEGLRAITVSPSQIAMEFAPAVYRLSAVKKAAYKFGDRCHIQIATIEGGRIQARLSPKNPAEDPQYLAGEFGNEVLDQELREQVAQETAAVRDLLMAQAFSATSLIDEEGEEADYRVDPLGIAGRPPKRSEPAADEVISKRDDLG